jgi:hypothetical protein
MSENITAIEKSSLQPPSLRRVQLESQLNKAIAKARIQYLENEPVQSKKKPIIEQHLGRNIDIYG